MNQPLTGAGQDVGRPASPARRPAGRPRSEAVRQAVLEAAYAILQEDGIGGFSIDAVARRSGVARTTIYRWWPSRSLLAMESFREQFQPQLEVPRSGHAEADFRALVTSLAGALAGPAGSVAASVVAHAQSDRETQRLFREQFSDPLRRESAKLMQAGIAQHQFRVDLEVDQVIDAFVGAVYLRLLLGSPLSHSWADALCDTLLNGCRARPDPASGPDGGAD